MRIPSRLADINLPVSNVLPELLESLRSSRLALLEAPPGAGKTTLVPPALLNQEWTEGGKILLLEPRRIAARNAAFRIAAILDEQPGGLVGYRMRGETRIGPTTRIEVLTEGILTAMLRNDPSLSGVAAVIFDEFHERSIHADLGLAFALYTADLFRPDLRIIIMSATLDCDRLATMLQSPPVIRSQGKVYPVETRYVGRDRSRRVEDDVAGAVRHALGQTRGDVLVFLPGVFEIERTADLLSDLHRQGEVELHTLHGSLPRTLQDRAILPSTSGKRKVVLSSAIAETSLTIEGVGVVVDAGLSRLPRFDPTTGLTRLVTIPVSRASADQRRGRAGRLGPGVCYRLWDEAENHGLRAAATPEILETDLLPLVLDLRALGAEPEELRWLDPPPPGPWGAALDLGERLGLLDAAGALTPIGRRALDLPLHPRLGRMILAAAGNADSLQRGAALAALLEEGDPLRRNRKENDPDLHLRLDLIERYERNRRSGSEGDRAMLERILREKRRLERLAVKVGKGEEGLGEFSAGELLAIAYPDRIAAQRQTGSNRYLLAGGRAARLPDRASPPAPFLVVPSLSGGGTEGVIELSVAIRLEEIERIAGDRIRRDIAVEWNADAGRVEIREDRMLDSLTLSSSPLQSPDEGVIIRGTIEGIRRTGLSSLPWSRSAEQLRERMGFLHSLAADRERGIPGEWPDVSDQGLLDRLEEWLTPLLMRGKGRNRLAGLDMNEALRNLLGWQERAELDRLAPERIGVPSGAQIRIDYSRPDEPILPVRLQEMFGGSATPRIASGQVPLTLHLLSPANRPVQITRDLEGFWKGSYAEVRREMRGRYPKHRWPENPQEEGARGS